MAKVLELQAAAAEKGQDLVSTLLEEQAELLTAMAQPEPQPEPEEEVVSYPDTPELEVETEVETEPSPSEVSWADTLVSVGGSSGTAAKKRERSPADKAKLAAVAARKLQERFGRTPAAVALRAEVRWLLKPMEFLLKILEFLLNLMAFVLNHGRTAPSVRLRACSLRRHRNRSGM